LGRITFPDKSFGNTYGIDVTNVLVKQLAHARQRSGDIVVRDPDQVGARLADEWTV